MIVALAFFSVLTMGVLLGVVGRGWWDRRRQYPRRPNPYWGER